MTYFDDMVSKIFTGRIKEMIDAKAKGRPVIGTFCIYVPEEIIQAHGGCLYCTERKNQEK